MAEVKVKSQSSLPMAGRRFYIDEVEVPKGRLKRLERSLFLLGAKLEKFFTKDIFCLITDHAQPADYKPRARSAEGVPVSTPSPFAVTPGSNTGAPSETSGSNAKASTSRAALMLTKSHEQNNRHGAMATASASEMLVRNAKQWSIKMLATDAALQWMEQKIASIGINKNKKRKKSSERPERAPRHGGKVLKAPYVKVEDKTLQYRPIYRQLTTDAVPILSTNAEHCPFETKGIPSALPPLNAIAAHAQEASDNADTTLNTSKLEVTDKVGKGKQPALKGKGGASQSKQVQKNKVDKKLTFCMVCKVRFEDIQQHLRSDQHVKFAEDDDNYTQVDKLVNTSASMQRFLDDIIKYHSVHQQEGLAQQKEMVIDSITPGVPLLPAGVSALPDEVDTPIDSPDNLMHRSVSDSQASVDSLTELPLGGHESPMSLQHMEADAEVNEVGHLQTTTTDDSGSLPAAAAPAVANDMTPNISKVVVNVKKPRARSKKAAKVLLQAANDTQPVEIGTLSLSGSHLSPSEIVKLRKRGASRTDSKKSPKKKSPVKRQSKAKTKQRKPSNLADVQAHWALLSGKKYNSGKNLSVLPMDVSYGALDDSQLEVMANQRESIGAMDDDDKSLVHSIHSMLHEVTFNDSLVGSTCDDTEDPLLSCDSYINQKLSHAQQNAMLKPATPRKSPRYSLGARDLPDEHFSPQKQRLSMSMEKERRLSESQHRLRKRISKLNLDRPISAEPSSPTEDKENISSPSQAEAANLSHIEAAQEEPDISCVSVANTDDSISKRKVLMSPNVASDDLQQTAPLHISTPAPDKLHITTPAPDEASAKATPSVVNSTPITNSIKKSLFDAPQSQQKAKTSSHRSRRSRKPSVKFRRDSIASKDYPDCFGFEDSGVKSNNNIHTWTTNAATASKSSSLRHTKFDYDRQNSLLSFGSVSLSQYDDVFSQPPDIQQIIDESESVEKSKQQPVRVKNNDYIGFSDSDLSSPGFKVSSAVRKKAAHARRIHQAGQTPRQKRTTKLSEGSPNTSRQSARLRGFAPDAVTESAANTNNNNNKRTRTIKSGNLSKKSKQRSPQVVSDTELPLTPVTTDKSPTRKGSAMKGWDILGTNTDTSAVEAQLKMVDLDESSFVGSHRSVSPTPSYRSLPDSARDSIIKHKYDYSVGGSNAGSQHKVKRRQQCSTRGSHNTDRR